MESLIHSAAGNAYARRFAFSHFVGRHQTRLLRHLLRSSMRVLSADSRYC